MNNIHFEYLIAEMNMCIAMINSINARANRELQVLGDWRCDHSALVKGYEDKFEYIRKTFENSNYAAATASGGRKNQNDKIQK